MPAPTATATPEARSATSNDDHQRPAGAVWGALEEALRNALGARAGWILGLAVPTFALQLELGGALTLEDELGHFALFGGLELGLVGGSELISLSGLLLSLIWLRIQAQAVAGLLTGFDRRNPVFERDRGVRTRDLWRAADPIANECFWILVARLGLMLTACVALLWLPGRLFTQLLDADLLELPTTLAILALALLTFLFLVVLEVATQLALVSCVANRRGPVSALQHAWRLLSSSPSVAVRAGAAHFALLIAVGLGTNALGGLPSGGLGILLALATIALAGVAQVCFWDRVYGLLGGWRALPPLPIRRRGAAASSSGTAPAT